MADDQLAQLLDSLKTWCDDEYGRRSEIARALNVPPSAVTQWLNGRQKPTGAQALEIIEFLKHRKK